MPGLLNLASAASTDLANAATVASGALKSFNMEASQSGYVADIIASASTSSATDVDGLGMALQNAGAIVASAGEDFALLAAITGKLADANINAAVAGTSTKIMFNRLAAPTGDAAKALDSMNIATRDASGNMLPFIDIMKSLESSMAGLGTAEKAEMLKRVFGEEAVGSVTVLLGQGISELDKYAESLRNSTGASAEMAAMKMNNFNGALTEQGSAFEGLQITIGTIFLPTLTLLMKGITFVIQKLNALAQHPVGEFFVGLVGVLAVAIISITAVSGLTWALGTGYAFVTGKITAFVVATKVATAAQWLWNVALNANPIGLVVLGVAALVGVMVALYYWFDPVTQAIDKLWNGFVGMLQPFRDFYDIASNLGMSGVLAYYFTDGYEALVQFWDGLKSLFDIDLGESGRKLMSTFTDGIKSVINVPVDMVKGGLAKMRNLLPFSDAKEGPLSSLTLSGRKVMDTLGVGIRAAAPALHSEASKALSGIPNSVAMNVLPQVGSLAGMAPVSLPGVDTAPEGAAEIPTVDKRKAPVASVSKEGKSITIHIDNLNLSGVNDADGFIKQLQVLAEASV
ncbi:MAG: phage tail tape measure protein [Desulfovibrio sp.]